MGVWLSCLPGEQRAVVPDERLPGQLQQHQGGAEPAGLRALLPAVSRGPLRRPRRPSRVRPPSFTGEGRASGREASGRESGLGRTL